MAMAAGTFVRTLQNKVIFSPISPVNQRIFPNGASSFCGTGSRRYFMQLKAKPVVEDGALRYKSKNVLLNVPENVVITPCSDSSAFLGSTSTESSFRHIFKLGIIEETRLLSLFRFKIWWMIPWVGKSAKDIPVETQMLLLDASKEQNSDDSPDKNPDYLLFLPILDGDFRSSLLGNSSNELEVCVETGDETIAGTEFLRAVFINCGSNPYELIKESMK